MKAPLLNKGNYSVLSSELNTGIILTIDGEYFLGEGKTYLKFESINSVEEFIRESLILNPDREYTVYDYEGNFVFIETKDGRRKK